MERMRKRPPPKKKKKKKKEEKLKSESNNKNVSWCFELSQPLGIIPGLTTNNNKERKKDEINIWKLQPPITKKKTPQNINKNH